MKSEDAAPMLPNNKPIQKKDAVIIQNITSPVHCSAQRQTHKGRKKNTSKKKDSLKHMVVVSLRQTHDGAKIEMCVRVGVHAACGRRDAGR